MNKLMTAYLFRGNTVVTDKSLIMNATDDEFEEVSLVLSQVEIERYSKELASHERMEEPQ